MHEQGLGEDPLEARSRRDGEATHLDEPRFALGLGERREKVEEEPAAGLEEVDGVTRLEAGDGGLEAIGVDDLVQAPHLLPRVGQPRSQR